MSNYEIIGKDVWGIKARNLMNVTNCSECRYNGYQCSAVDCGEFFYLKDEEVEKVGKKYKVIEKNEYGVLVESENSMSDCSECKYAKDRDVSCLKKCDSNIYRYYIPDSEVEKLEYENDLKAKNEELIKFLEDNIDCCKIPKDHKDPVDTATYSMYIAYKNVLEFIKNQK